MCFFQTLFNILRILQANYELPMISKCRSEELNLFHRSQDLRILILTFVGELNSVLARFKFMEKLLMFQNNNCVEYQSLGNIRCLF